VKNGEEVFNFSSLDGDGQDFIRKDYKIDKKDDTPRIIPTTHDKTQAASMMAGLITNPQSKDLKGVGPEDTHNIQDMLEDYEIKEANIIHDLYSKHFFPNG
jgi:hypothetical protein